MEAKKVCCKTLTAIGGGALFGGVNGIFSSGIGLVGAGILHQIESSFSPSEAISEGFIGGSIFGTALGIGIFAAGRKVTDNITIPMIILGSIPFTVISRIIEGLIGYGILYAADEDRLKMPIEKTVESFAFGAFITSCIFVTLLACFWSLKNLCSDCCESHEHPAMIQNSPQNG